jgi:ABC-type lipoprotein export system ATPase subunit
LRRKTIGFVFQSYHLFPELSAVENVALPGLYWGNNKELVHQRAHDLLRSFALGHRLHHRPPELSGGEQQRVALARALINDPDIVMADEPTGNLDADSGREIIDALELLHRQQHKTILMVTHDLAIARRADRILRMQDGRVAPFTPA